MNQLLKLDSLPKRVICTQPLHFFAIILAVRLANFIRYKDNKQIQRIDLYLTDLPTNKAIHFTGGLRRLHMLSQRCFEMIRLHTPKPVEPDADAFWKKEAHLEPHQIKYGSLPLSEPFKNLTCFLCQELLLKSRSRHIQILNGMQ